MVGIHAAESGSYMVVSDGSGAKQSLVISWNCIGWQSLILLGMTFLSGFRGDQAMVARVQIVVIGVSGTMLLNLMGVVAVAALAPNLGQTQAVLFHDYGGTILVVGWLVAFWVFVQRWILKPDLSDERQEAVA